MRTRRKLSAVCCALVLSGERGRRSLCWRHIGGGERESRTSEVLSQKEWKRRLERSRDGAEVVGLHEFPKVGHTDKQARQVMTTGLKEAFEDAKRVVVQIRDRIKRRAGACGTRDELVLAHEAADACRRFRTAAWERVDNAARSADEQARELLDRNDSNNAKIRQLLMVQANSRGKMMGALASHGQQG